VNWWEKRPEHDIRAIRHTRPSVSEIVPELLVGEYPRHEDIAWLRENFAVSAVHNLQDDEDLRLNSLDIAAMRETYGRHGIKLVRTPIQDGSADAMRERLEVALEDLRALVASHRPVYLHCNAGLNRAPTLAIAYLRACRKMSLDEALAHVKRRRSCGPFMTVLEDYFGPRHLRPTD